MVLFLFDAVNGFTVALKRDLDNDDGDEYDDNGVNVDGLCVTSSIDNNERLLTKYLFAAAAT